MALKSTLFKGDLKLEAAAMSDPAHIVEGARGIHVEKLQSGLNMLDAAGLNVDGIFGPATAAAVQAYKRARSIINRAYQASADSIVGKMTMARLDEEVLNFEIQPMVVKPLMPLEHPSRARSSSRLSLNFAFSADVVGFANIALAPSRVPTFPQVIIDLNRTGTFQVMRAAGARLRVTGGGGASTPIKLLNVKTDTTPAGEETDVDTNDKIFTYASATMCGQSAVNVLHPTKLFAGLSVLTLTDKIVKSTAAMPPPEPNSTTKLVSDQGTPLNPRPGATINLFGEGESGGFSDYSSDIRHCSTTSKGKVLHRPWTGDPRVGIGLDSGSIDNICCRGSPILQVTIDEIRRIAKPGCRVTYSSEPNQIAKLTAGLGITKPDDAGVRSNLPGHSFVMFHL